MTLSVYKAKPSTKAGVIQTYYLSDLGVTLYEDGVMIAYTKSGKQKDGIITVKNDSAVGKFFIRAVGGTPKKLHKCQRCNTEFDRTHGPCPECYKGIIQEAKTS